MVSNATSRGCAPIAQGGGVGGGGVDGVRPVAVQVLGRTTVFMGYPRLFCQSIEALSEPEVAAQSLPSTPPSVRANLSAEEYERVVER